MICISMATLYVKWWDVGRKETIIGMLKSPTLPEYKLC